MIFAVRGPTVKDPFVLSFLPHIAMSTRFGGSVTIEREDGRTQTWRIVGEDEADPAKGSVSHVSPLARALMGKQVGDEAVVAGQTVEITAVD